MFYWKLTFCMVVLRGKLSVVPACFDWLPRNTAQFQQKSIFSVVHTKPAKSALLEPDIFVSPLNMHHNESPTQNKKKKMNCAGDTASADDLVGSVYTAGRKLRVSLPPQFTKWGMNNCKSHIIQRKFPEKIFWIMREALYHGDRFPLIVTGGGKHREWRRSFQGPTSRI